MRRKLLSLILILSGVAAGMAVMRFAGPSGDRADSPTAAAQTAAPAKVWTCSMHPQIRMDHPGLCPLCGMDLTPVEEESEVGDGAVHLTLSKRARTMAKVNTAEVGYRELFKEIRTVGKVEMDETRVSNITSRVAGRVDEVFANFPGTPVRKGEHLVSIYSPELVSTQQEFVNAYRREQDRKQANRPDYGLNLAAGARKRLQLWGLTDQQLDELARSGKAQTHIVVYAPFGGTVVEKAIRAGQYVQEGSSLYTIADLSQVWLILDVYESELSWVRFGQPVQVTLESEPDRPVTGTVGFIEPTLNESTRTVKVRVVLENGQGKFKPGMYAQALIRVPILPGGKPAPTGLEGKYACPMHPYEVSDQPGTCRVCGMPLELVPGEPAPKPNEPYRVLAVPADAVLTTGQRQLVYVEREPGDYHLVEPSLGPRAGDYFPVVSGLEEGDRVVVRGNFLLDSQFQVSGKPSLLYPHGSTGGTGHEGHGAAPKPKDTSAKEQANLAKLSPEDKAAAEAQGACPITDLGLGSMGVPVKVTVKGRTVFLCCGGCKSAVEKAPDGVLKKLDAAAAKEPLHADAHAAHPAGDHATPSAGQAGSFFTADELENLEKLSPADKAEALTQRLCPITEEHLGSMGVPVKMTVKGRTIFLCCAGCEYSVNEDPDGTLRKVDQYRSGKHAQHTN